MLSLTTMNVSVCLAKLFIPRLSMNHCKSDEKNRSGRLRYCA